jgi:hypothetical protein
MWVLIYVSRNARLSLGSSGDAFGAGVWHLDGLRIQRTVAIIMPAIAAFFFIYWTADIFDFGLRVRQFSR